MKCSAGDSSPGILPNEWWEATNEDRNYGFRTAVGRAFLISFVSSVIHIGFVVSLDSLGSRKGDRINFLWRFLLAMALCGISVGLDLPVAAHAQSVKIPDVATVRGIDFEAPGIGPSSSGEPDRIKAVVKFLDRKKADWKPRAANRYAEFVITLELDTKQSMVIRAGRSEKAAFLQTTVSDTEVMVCEITTSQLQQLLKICGCDLSIALLQHDKGHFRKRLEEALAHTSTRIKAADLDQSELREMLISIVNYSRNNPKDADTSGVLRRLDGLVVEEFVAGWYSIEIWGCGFHFLSRLLVDQHGNAVAATPENCLLRCWKTFGPLDNEEAMRKVCNRVIKGSVFFGKMIKTIDEIPGYRKHPMPKEQERQIVPMRESFTTNGRAYGFFVYERLGGYVWHCVLTVEGMEGKSVKWDMREIAKGIGDAMYIR